MRAGHQVDVIPPRRLASAILQWRRRPPDCVIFTHGPGTGVVAASAMIRQLVRTKILWVATRPDLRGLPEWLRSLNTAHGVLCNRVSQDLVVAAKGALFVQQYIGIDPRRIVAGSHHPKPPVGDRASEPFVALHVGHLRPNRGLEFLAEAKRRLGSTLEVVVQASPAFGANKDVLDLLLSADVRVRRGYMSDIGSLYRAADLYVFPTRPESKGAIELPLGVLEAVAAGTPVLTTSFGALPDALDGIPGVTFAEAEAFVSTFSDLALGVRPLICPPGLPPNLVIDDTIRATLEMMEMLCTGS